MNKYKTRNKFFDDIDDGKRISPLKAIRAYCLECCGYNQEEVENCSANQNKETRCSLYFFRLGYNKTGKSVKNGL